MSARRRQAGRGALAILALFLAASGALRLGDFVGRALANAAEADVAGPDGIAAAPLQCPEPPLALAEALIAREATLRVQESALADRLAALALADAAVTARLAELAAAEADLKQTLALADGAAENDLVRLTAVYEAMKPADAAALFETMAPEFAAGFLGRMRPETAAAVMSGMSSEAAYSISVLIAGRNALVPTE